MASARGRIVGWAMVLVALALVVSMVIAAQVLLSRVESSRSAEIMHEGEKLRAYVADAANNGAAYTSVSALLSGFMRDVLPEFDETFFSVVDGEPDFRSAQRPLARLDTDPNVIALAAAAKTPVTTKVATSAGPALVGVFPVRAAESSEQASLVVVEFLAPARAEAWATIRVLAIINASALVLAGIAAWLIAGRVLRPIRQVRTTAERISETDLSSRITVSGNDDVAQLAQTFNRMLDRLQAAFQTQREFLDDAGHELRTPLTIVRGHLELMGDDPAERAETVPLLLDEIDRMRRLVDDLLLLAQAQRPDFLRLAETDLADVVVDMVAKASAMAPRTWQIDAVADARILADEQRLTQALTQLCSNAVAHTGEGDTIAVGSSATPQRVQLWVRDTGAGVDPAEAQRIFTRSVRGQHAARRGGSGLGLAIVSSIAAAHGGTVNLDSTPGEGALFTLDLPRRAAGPSGGAAHG